MNELVIIRVMVSAIMLLILCVWHSISNLVDTLRHIDELLDELVKTKNEE